MTTTKTDQLHESIRATETRITETNTQLDALRKEKEEKQEQIRELLRTSGNDAVSRFRRNSKLKGSPKYESVPPEVAELEEKLTNTNKLISEKDELLVSLGSELNSYHEELNELKNYDPSPTLGARWINRKFGRSK